MSDERYGFCKNCQSCVLTDSLAAGNHACDGIKTPVAQASMSENSFADCDNPGLVLSQHVLKCNSAGTISETLRLRDDALARIRELTPPPTVSEEARERLVSAVHADRWDRALSSRQFACRIIDALGYTPAPDEFSDPANWHPIEEHPYLNDPPSHVTASPLVVELDVQDLGRLAGFLNQWAEMSLQLGVDINHRLPIGCGVIVNREDDGAWVLRIGGTDE